MKLTYRLLITLCFITSGLLLQAQPTNQFNGTYDISMVTTGGVGEYQVTGVFNNYEGDYSGVDIAIGDKFFDGKCGIYEVVAIDDDVPQTIVQADRTEGTLLDPTPGLGFLYRPTTNYDYPLEPTGVPDKLQTCIQRYTAIKTDQVVSGALATDTRVDTVYINQDTLKMDVLDVVNGNTLIKRLEIPLEQIANALPNNITMRGSFYQQITGQTGTSFTWNFCEDCWIVTRNGVLIDYEAVPANVTDYGITTGTIEFHTSVPLVSGDIIEIRSK